MLLTKEILKEIDRKHIQLPDTSLFALPEKVIQFGTGVLLRGLPDYFIDKANKAGKFNGRIVVVKSTEGGDSAAFDQQNSLFTHCIRGMDNGTVYSENIINASISRVLSARSQWKHIFACAHQPDIKIIISNTTEVGIQLVNESPFQTPPQSFPAKLLSFLLERYKAFQGSPESGMVIVPTELITDNGKRLRSIVLELSRLNNLSPDFIKWVENHNRFCNSLVDRIVPGRPAPSVLEKMEQELGYQDSLLIMSELYRLWAIEGDEHIRALLSFADTDQGVIIQPDIDIYRELKLRLLNGTHTACCGLAFLAGCRTVKEAMETEWMARLVQQVMLEEIARAIPYQVDEVTARQFGLKVLDRFRNPAIEHEWINITMQFTSKLKMRLVPVVREYFKRYKQVPMLLSTGLAAWILFMKSTKEENGQYYGQLNREWYPIKDDAAARLHSFWQQPNATDHVRDLLEDQSLWGENLALYEGFAQAIQEKLKQMLDIGVDKVIQSLEHIKVNA